MVAQKNILNVGLYIALFPQLVAGPIVRYDTIAKEIHERKENIEDALLDCLSYVGEIKSIERSADELALEIWVTVDGEAYVMYFFDYGRGIVLCQ